MPKYDVRALAKDSSAIVNERTEATSVDEIRTSFALRGMTVLHVEEVGTGLKMQIGGAKRVKPMDLAVFSRMFATIVSAGVPVLRALQMMSEETKHPTLREALEDITSQVESGQKLSSALESHPTVFPPVMVSLVATGEEGGFLDDALVQTAVTLEKQVKLAADVKSAATYPIVVLSMGVLAGAGMLLFILPIFATMFNDLGGELPLITRMAMTASDILKVVAIPLVIALVVFGVWWRRHKSDDKVRRVVDPWRLRPPIFGNLARRIAVSRSVRVLSVMLRAGVPLVTALEKSAPTANNKVIEDAYMSARAQVVLGQPLSEFISEGGHIPTLVGSMVKAGEDSGAIDEMLTKVADFYDQQIEAQTKQLSSILEPLLIVIVGVMIGTLVIAMYMPMFSVFDLIQ